MATIITYQISCDLCPNRASIVKRYQGKFNSKGCDGLARLKAHKRGWDRVMRNGKKIDRCPECQP